MPDPLQASTVDAADADLVGRLAAGEANALSLLYARHRRRIYQFALLWTGHASSAADVTQDVFVHLPTHSREFDATRGAVLPWLLGIARNFSRRRTGRPRHARVRRHQAQGTQTTYTIPAGEIGNEKPIIVSSERWFSPELHVVVYAKTSDPRAGETTYRLTNIKRGEPPAELFRAPDK